MDSSSDVVSLVAHGICKMNRDICNAIQHLLLKYGIINENNISPEVMLFSPEGGEDKI
jgi:hypothetical protein